MLETKKSIFFQGNNRMLPNILVQNFMVALFHGQGFMNTVGSFVLNGITITGIEFFGNLFRDGLDYLNEKIFSEEKQDHFLVKGFTDIASGLFRLLVVELVDNSSWFSYCQNYLNKLSNLNKEGLSALDNFDSSSSSFLDCIFTNFFNSYFAIPRLNSVKSIFEGTWTIIKGIYNYFTNDNLQDYQIKSLIKAGSTEAIKLMYFEKLDSITSTEELLEEASRQTIKKVKILEEIKNNPNYQEYSTAFNILKPLFLETKNCKALQKLYSNLFKEDPVKYKEAMFLVDLEADYYSFRHFIKLISLEKELLLLYGNSPTEYKAKLKALMQQQQKIFDNSNMSHNLLQREEKELGLKFPKDENIKKYSDVMNQEWLNMKTIEIFESLFDF
jgi:hypothetical protein